MNLHIKGLSGAATATMASLHAPTYEATNTIVTPTAIVPVEGSAQVAGPNWAHTVLPLTIEVIDIPLARAKR